MEIVKGDIDMETKESNTEEKVALPMCPYCGLDPVLISARSMFLNDIHCLMIFCGNTDCRKLFAVEAIGKVEAPNSKPRIMIPS